MSNPPYMLLAYIATDIDSCKPKEQFIIIFLWTLVFSTVTLICLISCHPLKCKCMYCMWQREKRKRERERTECSQGCQEARNDMQCLQSTQPLAKRSLWAAGFGSRRSGTDSNKVHNFNFCQGLLPLSSSLSFLLKGPYQNIIFLCEKCITHFISVNDWHYSQEN